MIARAVEKYVRMSPRKVRYVIEPLRQKTVSQALNILSSVNRRAAKPVFKAIASAFANARQADPTLNEDQVVISQLFADGGPTWKRHRAAAFGRAVMILKRTSHITVVLDRINGRRPEAAPVAQHQTAAPAKRGGRKPAATRRPSGKKPVARKKRAAAGKKA